MITEDQYNQLIKFEPQLHTTYSAGYVHIAPYDLRKVLEIYYGKDWQLKAPKSVFSCGHCKLNEVKKIATEFYEYDRSAKQS